MMKKRIFAGVLALLMVCGMLSGCAAREAERWDVLATTGPVWSMDRGAAGGDRPYLRPGHHGKRLLPA